MLVPQGARDWGRMKRSKGGWEHPSMYIAGNIINREILTPRKEIRESPKMKMLCTPLECYVPMLCTKLTCLRTQVQVHRHRTVYALEPMEVFPKT